MFMNNKVDLREWKRDRTLTFGHNLVEVRPQTRGFAQYVIIGGLCPHGQRTIPV